MKPVFINCSTIESDGFGKHQLERYGLYLNQTIEIKKKEQLIKKNVSRKYIFEIQKYDGFAMIKFYPRCKLNDANRYMLRSEDLGFQLNKANFTILMNGAIRLMKDYLSKNKNNYIGYIGQTDYRDNRSKKLEIRLKSQRRRLYHLITFQAFKPPFYMITDEDFYTEINLRLIRRIVVKNPKKRSVKQKNNYLSFDKLIKNNQNLLIEFMTNSQRELLFGE